MASGSFTSSIVHNTLWLIVKWEETNTSVDTNTSDVVVEVTVRHGGLYHTSKPITLTLGEYVLTGMSPSISTTDYSSFIGQFTFTGVQHDDVGDFSASLAVQWDCDMHHYGTVNPVAVPYLRAEQGITLDNIPVERPDEPVSATSKSGLILLYDGSETEFNHNGYGSLNDAVSCTVTEKLNDEYELQMRYAISGKHFNDISLGKIILAKPNYYTRPQPFVIYDISKPLNGTITINAQHVSYMMSGYPVRPFYAQGATSALNAIRSHCIESSPFSFYTDLSTDGEFYIFEPCSMRAAIGGGEENFLSVFGGELEYDRFKVKILQARGMDRGVTIRYGKNLTSLEQDENCAEVYSKIFPYYYASNGDTDNYVELPEVTIDTGAKTEFNKTYAVNLAEYFDDVPTVDELRTVAEYYIYAYNVSVPKVSLNVSFVQLSQSEEYKEYESLEKVLLGDTVTVIFPKLGVNAKAKCVSTVFDCLTQKYESIGLGDPEQTLAATIAGGSQTISGGSGGGISPALIERIDELTELVLMLYQRTAVVRVSELPEAGEEYTHALYMVTSATSNRVSIGAPGSSFPYWLDISLTENERTETAQNVTITLKTWVGDPTAWPSAFSWSGLADYIPDVSSISVNGTKVFSNTTQALNYRNANVMTWSTTLDIPLGSESTILGTVNIPAKGQTSISAGAHTVELKYTPNSGHDGKKTYACIAEGSNYIWEAI